MPIPDRDALEKKYARIIARLLRIQMGRLLELMGDPPRLENVPPQFWEQHGLEMYNALLPFGEQIYLEAAERMLQTVTGGGDWALVNEAAIDWVESYTMELVRGINSTSRQAITRAVQGFYRGELTQKQVIQRLSNIYSPVRAEMIAITEITRASVEGERAVVREIGRQGIQMVEVWRTANDDIVCPICEPRNGKPKGEGWNENDGPPAHPRCRCDTSHEFVRL